MTRDDIHDMKMEVVIKTSAKIVGSVDCLKLIAWSNPVIGVVENESISLLHTLIFFFDSSAQKIEKTRIRF